MAYLTILSPGGSRHSHLILQIRRDINQDGIVFLLRKGKPMDRNQVGERIHITTGSKRPSIAFPTTAFMACRNPPTTLSGFFQMQVNDPHIVVTRGSNADIPREIIFRPKRETDP